MEPYTTAVQHQFEVSPKDREAFEANLGVLTVDKKHYDKVKGVWYYYITVNRLVIPTPR